MADAAPCGVALCDRNGVILHLNSHLDRALSADRENETVRQQISGAARAAVPVTEKTRPIETTSPAPSDVRTQCARYTLSAALLENERVAGRVCSIVFVDAQTARMVGAKAISSRYGLTRRETEIALLLQRGFSSRDIAAATEISVNTVRRHIERVMAKFNVHTRLGVAAKLIE
jgi:DNA-binding NarL/FixJ family response regulator